MRAWQVRDPAPMAQQPLRLAELDDPEPGPGEVRVRVVACGVCRTDLHLAEGDLAPHRPNTVPGHEVVGIVDRLGEDAARFSIGERIGVAWLRRTCGVCRFCRRGDENLCVSPEFTGWDADGGFAELAVVPEAFAYRLPESFDDLEAAPLLCAGIIGYRSLRRTGLFGATPRAGARLGIYGFGASAHLAAQVAMHQGAEVHVLTRSEEARELATQLGAASVGGAYDRPPVLLDAAILFAPVGELVPPALEALDRGGVLSIAGIHLSDVPPLNYQRDLFFEREVRSVTANTRTEGEEFLELAAGMPLRPTVTPYGFDRVDDALADLAADRVDGAAVIRVQEPAGD